MKSSSAVQEVDETRSAGRFDRGSGMFEGPGEVNIVDMEDSASKDFGTSGMKSGTIR